MPLRRNSLIGDAIHTCHQLPDRPEHGDRHVVRDQSHIDARIDEIPHRRDLAVLLRREFLLEEVGFLEDIAISVWCDDQTHADNFFDVARRQRVDMADNPASSLKRGGWSLSRRGLR